MVNVWGEPAREADLLVVRVSGGPSRGPDAWTLRRAGLRVTQPGISASASGPVPTSTSRTTTAANTPASDTLTSAEGVRAELARLAGAGCTDVVLYPCSGDLDQVERLSQALSHTAVP